MKCDLCSWNQTPENIRDMKIHLNDQHRFNEEICVVWRDGQMVSTTSPGEDRILEEVEIVKAEVPENPPMMQRKDTPLNVTVEAIRKSPDGGQPDENNPDNRGFEVHRF